MTLTKSTIDKRVNTLRRLDETSFVEAGKPVMDTPRAYWRGLEFGRHLGPL